MTELQILIESIRAGDREAFGALAEQSRDMVVGYAYALLQDVHLAEDAAQEALLAAYHHLDALRRPDAFDLWLRGIVRHQCRRIQRQRRRTPASLEEGGDLPTHQPGPEQWMQSREVLRCLQQALDSLPPALREAAVRHYLEEQTHQQIADALGWTVSTVNNRLYAARQRLKRRMSAMFEPEDQKQTQKQIEPGSAPLAAGRVVRTLLPFLDVEFPVEARPALFSRLLVGQGEGRDELCVVSCQGENLVRCLPTGRIGDHIGQSVEDTGTFCVRSLPTDLLVKAIEAIPSGSNQEKTLLETGIKSIDLFAPLARRGINGFFAEWGVGVLVLLPELLYRLTSGSAQTVLCAFVQPPPDERTWKEQIAEIAPGTEAVPAYYFPVEDPIDPEFIARFNTLDACIRLTRRLAEQAIYPCVDPLASSSRLLTEQGVGSRHIEVAQEAAALIRRYETLMFSPEGVRDHALSRKDWEEVFRARKVVRFLSQPFYVAEPFTKRPGRSVLLAETVQGFAALVNGDYADLNREAFYMVGTLQEAIGKAQAAA